MHNISKIHRMFFFFIFVHVFVLLCPAGAPVYAEDRTPEKDLRQSNSDSAAHKRSVSSLLKSFTSRQLNQNWKHLKQMKIVSITEQEAIFKALKTNLSVQISKEDESAALSAIHEAEAVFTPVLNFSVGYSKNETHQRGPKTVTLKTKIIRYPTICFSQECCQYYEELGRSNDVAGCEGFTNQEMPDNQESSSDPRPYQIKFRDQAYGETVQKEIFASQADPNGPIEATSYSIRISQYLPWGVTMDIGLGFSDKESFYDSLGNTYDAPWAGSAELNLMLPFPKTKGSGPATIPKTNLESSNINKKKSFWVVQSVINATLKQVSMAYWDAVKSLEFLNIALDNTKRVQEHLKYVEMLYTSHDVLEYNFLQAKAEMANTVLHEERSWNDFILKCISLSILLGGEKEVDTSLPFLFVPHDYEKTINQEFYANIESLDNAVDIAMKHRPEVHINKLDMDMAEVSMRAARNGMRPEINFSVKFNLSQNADVYGYKSLWDSMTHLHKPDSTSQTYTLAASYPFRNNLGKSIYAQSKIAVESQEMSHLSTTMAIKNEIRDALAQMTTLNNRFKTSKKIKWLAEQLHKENLLGKNDVPEYRMILMYRQLNSARQAYISAMINLEKADRQLKYAKGIIAASYAEKSNAISFNKLRLEILRSNRILNHFDPI